MDTDNSVIKAKGGEVRVDRVGQSGEKGGHQQ